MNPLGARTALEYGENGEPAATIDPLGRRVEQELDDLGNVSRVRLPDGAVWEFTHDAMSRLRQTVDPSGGVWTRHGEKYIYKALRIIYRLYNANFIGRYILFCKDLF